MIITHYIFMMCMDLKTGCETIKEGGTKDLSHGRACVQWCLTHRAMKW